MISIFPVYVRDELTYVFSEHKEFSAESRGDRLFVTASLRATIVTVIIFWTVVSTCRKFCCW